MYCLCFALDKHTEFTCAKITHKYTHTTLTRNIHTQLLIVFVTLLIVIDTKLIRLETSHTGFEPS